MNDPPENTALLRAENLLSPVGITFEPADGSDPVVAKDAEPSVTVRGEVGELVLFAYGRQDHSRIEIIGDDASIDSVSSASFGI